MTDPDLVVPWSELLFVPWPELLAESEAAVQRSFAAREEQTRHINSYSDRLVPGLLQTPGYARVVLREAIRRYQAPGGLDAAVAARMARRTVLNDSDKTIHAVLHQDVLYQQVGEPSVMAEQMRRLAGLAARPPVALRLGVLPRTSGYLTALGGGGFDLYESTVCQETTAGLLILTHPAVVADCHRHHQEVAGLSRYGAQAVELIDQARLHWEQP